MYFGSCTGAQGTVRLLFHSLLPAGWTTAAPGRGDWSANLTLRKGGVGRCCEEGGEGSVTEKDKGEEEQVMVVVVEGCAGSMQACRCV